MTKPSLVKFPRHPEDGETPWYDVMEEWMNAVEKEIELNRKLNAYVWYIICLIAVIAGLILGKYFWG